MDRADTLILAVAAVADLTVFAILAGLRQCRVRKVAAFRIAAGLRSAFHTGRLVPVQLPVELPLE